MQTNASATQADAVSDWLESFHAYLSRGDVAGAAQLFVPEAHWRDMLAFTWDIRSFSGRRAIQQAFSASIGDVRGLRMRLSFRVPPRLVTRVEQECVEALFDFETTAFEGTGVVRLVRHGDAGLRAWTLLTAMESIRGHEERVGDRRRSGIASGDAFGGDNWLDQRIAAQRYEDSDPEVLIVGGGQAGLSLAARLRQLDVDALIVDRIEHVGDNWRNRYHSLSLHNEVWVAHLPYMPFPETWPVYVPKDMLANWFAAYVDALELNFWTSTEFLKADYDVQSRCWIVVLRRRDGTERVMHPKHLVMAPGVSGKPHIPDLPGLGTFAGRILHSTDFSDGSEFKDRRVIVVGAGNSGHDVAQDLHGHGAEVVMVQRGPTTVLSLQPSAKLVYPTYVEGWATEDCDLLGLSAAPLHHRGSQLMTQRMRELDADLIAGLNRAGFKTTYGDDDTGLGYLYFQRGGGYYVNVGCSELIIEGAIKVVPYESTDRFTHDGLRLADNSVIEADGVVLATGYKSFEDDVRARLSDETADRVGLIWGFDEEGELRGIWRRTPQPGLWFAAGSLVQCRVNSKYLALQLKACQLGLIDDSIHRPL